MRLESKLISSGISTKVNKLLIRVRNEKIKNRVKDMAVRDFPKIRYREGWQWIHHRIGRFSVPILHNCLVLIPVSTTIKHDDLLYMKMNRIYRYLKAFKS